MKGYRDCNSNAGVVDVVKPQFPSFIYIAPHFQDGGKKTEGTLQQYDQ